ncbi:MAG TPA: hypothetical protein VIK18_12670, partial [Pirellulales bacterium]
NRIGQDRFCHRLSPVVVLPFQVRDARHFVAALQGGWLRANLLYRSASRNAAQKKMDFLSTSQL